MVKIALFYLMTIVSFCTLACTGEVLVFRGLNSALDYQSVQRYASHNNLCLRVFDWQQYAKAIATIEQSNNEYHLYGFSKGAESVMKVLERVERKPAFVVTVGAYKTTNVDFSKFNVKFINVFDWSGQGQQSPGVFINVPHYKVQQAANQILLK